MAQIQNGEFRTRLRLSLIRLPVLKTYCVPAGLGEFKIRDLNDEINKLLREKGHWEYRIKELGGPDYRVTSPVCGWLLRSEPGRWKR